MNELYAADPAVCSRASELKLLLASFGPYAGRYLANYPIDWSAQVERQFDTVGQQEAARVKTLLRRARETLTLITRANLPWNMNQAWLANATPLLHDRHFDGLIAVQADLPAVHPFDTLDLPPTAEERISGIASEYAHVAKILLLLSPELVVIDPYLNPLKRNCAPVLKAMFDLAAKGKSQKFTLWVRASEILSTGSAATILSDLETVLHRMVCQANFKPGRSVEMILVEDETRQTKMHARYLLSIKGGIRLDQGFQQLPQGRHVDAGPIGQTIHNALLDIYFDGKHDMRVVERLIISL